MISDVIKTALTKSQKKLLDVADCYKCSPSVIYSKMRRSSWSASDLARIADLVGAKLVFEFPDGDRLQILKDHPIPKREKEKSEKPSIEKKPPVRNSKKRQSKKQKAENTLYEQTMLDLDKLDIPHNGFQE